MKYSIPLLQGNIVGKGLRIQIRMFWFGSRKLILDGNSEIIAHVLIQIGMYLFKEFFRSTPIVIFFS